MSNYKNNVPVFTAKIANRLLKMGYSISYVSPNRLIPNCTVFYFKDAANLSKNIESLSKDIKDAKLFNEYDKSISVLEVNGRYETYAKDSGICLGVGNTYSEAYISGMKKYSRKEDGVNIG